MKANYDDILTRKSLSEILGNLDCLMGMALLFNVNSRYFRFSGILNGILRRDADDSTILSLWIPDEGMVTMVLSAPELSEAILVCDAFIGDTAEESFLITYD